MRVVAAFVLLFTAILSLSHANILLPPPPVVSSYVGPGDQFAFTYWGGLRCYSTAKATGTTKAVNVRAASGPNVGTSTDAVCLTTGKLDIASLTTFAGTDATCTASSISTTTLTVGTCTANLTVGDEISGGTIAVGTYITGTGCTTTPGTTCTVNISQTVSSTSITAAGALFVAKLYNQTGNTPCATSTTCDLVQATADNTHQPVLLLTCAGLTSLPCVAVPAISTVQLVSATSFTPNAAKLATYSWVYERVSGTQGVTATSENSQNVAGNNAGANAVRVLGGASGSVTETCSDAAWHAGAGVANTTSSIAYCDGAAGTTGTVTNSTTNGNPGGMFSGTTTVMLYSEVGFADNSVANSTQISNLHTNQSTYYGTP